MRWRCSARCSRSRSTASTTTRSSTPSADEVLHGGNFYGGHVAFAMDGLKAAVASVADLLDRQLALLCNPTTSHGLPANLVAREGDAQRRPPRLQGDADHRLRADRRGAEADHAGQRLQPQHGVAQPGQGQHGIDRRARLPAGAGADRDGGDRSSCSRCARRSTCAGRRAASAAAARCTARCGRWSRATTAIAGRTSTSPPCSRSIAAASCRSEPKTNRHPSDDPGHTRPRRLRGVAAADRDSGAEPGRARRQTEAGREGHREGARRHRRAAGGAVEGARAVRAFPRGEAHHAAAGAAGQRGEHLLRARRRASRATPRSRSRRS